MYGRPLVTLYTMVPGEDTVQPLVTLHQQHGGIQMLVLVNSQHKPVDDTKVLQTQRGTLKCYTKFISVAQILLESYFIEMFPRKRQLEFHHNIFVD